MNINQLQDDGAVIGYQPTLSYKKEIVQESNTSAIQNMIDNADTISYSATLESMQNNLPTVTLGNIDFVIDNMQTLIGKLAASFPNGNWGQYGSINALLSAIHNGDTQYANQFIEYHQNTLEGSIIPELIGVISDAKQHLETLQSTLKELYYGDASLSTQDAQIKDDAYIQQLKALEMSNQKSKINYVALAFDGILNRSVSLHAFALNERVMNIASIIDTQEATSGSSSSENTVKRLFDEVNNDIKYRKNHNSTQQSIEIMQKTLYNYYNKRQELLELYDLFSSNNESAFIGNRIQKSRMRLNESIANVNRTFAGNQYYLSEMVKSESEKYFLKNLYASLSHTADN